MHTLFNRYVSHCELSQFHGCIINTIKHVSLPLLIVDQKCTWSWTSDLGHPISNIQSWIPSHKNVLEIAYRQLLMRTSLWNSGLGVAPPIASLSAGKQKSSMQINLLFYGCKDWIHNRIVFTYPGCNCSRTFCIFYLYHLYLVSISFISGIYIICIWYLYHLYLVSISFVSGIYIICIRYLYHLFLVSISFVSGSYIICIWYLYHLYLVSLSFVSGIYIICIWYLYHFYLVSISFVRSGSQHVLCQKEFCSSKQTRTTYGFK